MTSVQPVQPQKQPDDFLLEKHSKEFFKTHVVFFNPHTKRLDARQRMHGETASIENEDFVIQRIYDFFGEVRDKVRDVEAHNLHKNIKRVDSLLSVSRSGAKRKPEEMKSLTESLKEYLTKFGYTVLCDAERPEKEFVVSHNVLGSYKNELLFRLGPTEVRVDRSILLEAGYEKDVGFNIPESSEDKKSFNEFLLKYFKNPSTYPECSDNRNLLVVTLGLIQYRLPVLAHYYLNKCIEKKISNNRVFVLIRLWASAKARNLVSIINVCKLEILKWFLSQKPLDPSEDNLKKVLDMIQENKLDIELDEFFPEFGIPQPEFGVLTPEQALKMSETKYSLMGKCLCVLFPFFPHSKRMSLSMSHIPHPRDKQLTEAHKRLYSQIEFLHIVTNLDCKWLVNFPNVKHLIIDPSTAVPDDDIVHIPGTIETLSLNSFNTKTQLTNFLTKHHRLREITFTGHLPLNHESVLRKNKFTKVENTNTYRRTIIG
jgi:hypothetical protein